jgi:hypothetical protein
MLRKLGARALAGARACKWGLVVTVLTAALFIGVLAATGGRGAGSDGYYTWLWARSITFDHDIDFSNDYAICGDPAWKNLDRGTGHRDNPFYVGPSVIWVPVLWFEKTVHRFPPTATTQERLACHGYLTNATLAVSTVVGALTVWLMYLAARRWAGDGPAALAAALLGLTSPLPAYAVIMPSYSHGYDAFFAALTVLTALRAWERPRSVLRWAVAGACVGIGLLQRPVSVLYGIVPGVLAIQALWRQPGRLAVAVAALGMPAVALGLVPQVLIYRYLYGTLWAGAPHGRFFMQYGHAHPWLLLFAPHGGLFYQCPAIWLAVLGAVMAVRTPGKRLLVAVLFVACCATVWLSAASIDWTGSGTFGARRLTSMLPLVSLPMGLALVRIGKWLRRRPGRAMVLLGAAVATPLAFTTLGGAYALHTGRMPTDIPNSQAVLYGVGDESAWSLLDEHVGDVAVLPAGLFFRLRYGVPMTSLRDATEPIYYRNYRTMEMGPHDVDLMHGHHAHLVTGFEPKDDGMRMVNDRATVVFAAQWPYATSIAVRAHASEPCKLRIGRGGPFGMRTWYGDFMVGPTESTTPVTIPPGGFDSGIMEIVIEKLSGTGEVTVSWLSFDDTNKYPPPL